MSSGAALCFFSSLCWLVTTQDESVGKVTSFLKTQRTARSLCVCVCFWEGMSGWAHRSAASSYLLCHTDGSVSEPQTLLLQQGRRENAANYSTHSILHRSFLGSVTSFHTVYLWLVGDSAGHCKWLRVKHKYQRLEEHHQHLFWFNVAWIYELFWLFALKVQYFTFFYRYRIKMLIFSKQALHSVHIPGRGACKRSSPVVVQHSALRWPASILQRKKSISGHRLGWLI